MHHHSHGKNLRLWLGLIAFISGAVILLERFDLVPVETWSYVWPVILIIYGVKLMVSEPTCCEKHEEAQKPIHKEEKANKHEEKVKKESHDEKKHKKKKKK